MKNLEVGKNYYDIFGNQEKNPGRKMIYNGGISWTAVDGDRIMTQENQQMTDNAIAYINKSTNPAGRF